jgi:hypothetical protein
MSKRERLRQTLHREKWNELAVRDGILETELSGTEKLVLLAVVSHRGTDDHAGGGRGLSVRRIATLASVSKDTPSAVLARLERVGLVRVLREHDRAPARFDLSVLPDALNRLLSEPEGHALSEQKGQGVSELCPFPPGTSVPSDPTRLSEQKGSKGSGKGSKKGSLSSRRSAPSTRPGFTLESPEPAKAAARRQPPRKAARKRTDAEVARHREILDGYVSAVETKTRQRPAIGSREASAGWKLLDWAEGDGPRAVAIVCAAASRDFGGSTSLVTIAADPNKYLGGNPSKGKRPGPIQPNGGTWRVPVERSA